VDVLRYWVLAMSTSRWTDIGDELCYQLHYIYTDTMQYNKLIITGLGYTNLQVCELSQKNCKLLTKGQANIMSMPEHAIQLTSVIVA
jgi:hypothetical protein